MTEEPEEPEESKRDLEGGKHLLPSPISRVAFFLLIFVIGLLVYRLVLGGS